MKIYPAKSLRGAVSLPGDKSISHRAALLSSMAIGETRIENFSPGADCASTLACLQDLGVEIRRDNAALIIEGVGKTGFRKPDQPLDCGNSGTTMRLLAGILAGQNFDSILTGDESLRLRPMTRVIEPLVLMNAEIEADNGHAPLEIFGVNPLQAIDYEPNTASAQIKSCVLLAGLNAKGKTSVLERIPTRDHTERMMRWLGVDVEERQRDEGKILSVSGDAKLTAKDLQIPGDISSAAFFMVAAACLNDSHIVLKKVGLNPTRTAIIEVLQNFGAQVEILNNKETCNEPAGDLSIKGMTNLVPEVSSNILKGRIIANLIDEVPILAIFGTQLRCGIEIRDAGELRIKESDRISAIVENLRRMNAVVEEFPDGFRIEKSNLKGAKIDSFGDHRIAMAFAVAGLFAEGETEIEGAECADISFPGFFDILNTALNY